MAVVQADAARSERRGRLAQEPEPEPEPQLEPQPQPERQPGTGTDTRGADSSPLGFFRPAAAPTQGQLDAAIARYAAAREGSDDAALTEWNVDTARHWRLAADRSPPRDFVVASARLELDGGEPVFVTARWRRADALAAVGAQPTSGDEWVEQRCLRFGSETDPPENTMVRGQPLVCQKAYMRVSFFALGLLDRPPGQGLAILLVGLGAGQLTHLWRRHLPRTPGQTHTIHCVEKHAEVVELARAHFDLEQAAEGVEVTVRVQDGQVALQQAAAASYDLVVVDLSVGSFVDAATCRDLRRVLRPGGVCVHNYTSCGTPGDLTSLEDSFAEVHRLEISAQNTVLVSATQEVGATFQQLTERAAKFPYATPLLFNLRDDLQALKYHETDEKVVTAAGEPALLRGTELLDRVQRVAATFTTCLRQTNLKIVGRAQPNSDEAKDSGSGAGEKVQVVEQVLLRKILATNRGQAATLARSLNAIMDAVSDCRTKSGLAELNSMLDTAAIRVQRLEDRSAQVERGEMLDQTSSSSSSDDD